MKTVEIPENHHRSFYNYISRLNVSVDNYSIRRVEDTDTLVPHNTGFCIDYLGEQVLVKIEKEYPKALYNGDTLTFLWKITLSHDNFDVLKGLTDCITINCKSNSGTIQIYLSTAHAFWNKSSRVHGQKLENIFLPQKVKTDLIDHIDTFLGCKEKYLAFGRTYKLCFLFTGVPGAGKSSLIKAIAIKYNRPIYILSLSKKMDDDILNNLISEVVENSIIVLEDIDSFFMDREAKDINISFSAILNMFDGLFSPGNGSILFMTANNPERLDTALIRPGRVDRIVKFDYPRRKEINDAFDKIIGGGPDNFLVFWNSIQGKQISMAGIVDYLFRHPVDYLECIDELNDHTKLLGEITNKNATFYK
jgi:chaperone BCS1